MQAAGDGPDMHVVHRFHARHFLQRRHDFIAIHLFRRAFHQNMHRRFQHAPATSGNQKRHRHARQWVGPAPAKRHHQQSRGNRAHRAQQIAQHMQISAAHIHIALGVAAAVHIPSHKNIHRQADAAHHQHAQRGDFGRPDKAAGGFIDNPHRNQQQR